MSTGRIVTRKEPEVRGGAILPLLGRLKTGIKAKSAKTGKEYPASIDYFRADGKYANVFHQVYGERPTRVQIVFPSNNPSDVCSERYVVRDGAGRLLAEGDGESWRVWSPTSSDYVFVPKPGADPVTIEYIEKVYCGGKMGGKLTIELRLSFILPKIPSVMGIWQFSTKGVRSSIPAIRDTFDYVLSKVGQITNIPFDLIVEKVKSNKPGSTSVFPVVNLVPNVSDENLDMLAGYIQQGKKLRGMLTESRITALVAEVVPDDEAIPALAAPAQLALPAAPQAAEAEVHEEEEPAPAPAEDPAPADAPAAEPANLSLEDLLEDDEENENA